MTKRYLITLFIFLTSNLYAQDKEPTGIPPARVVVGEVSTGVISPQVEFVGTVYYKEVSRVASEVDGSVGEVYFEEGERIKKEGVLVKLSSDILEKTILSRVASYEETVTDLEKARRDLERMEGLYKEGVIAEQVYDEHNFRVKGLEKRAVSLKRDVERLEVELNKKVIKAPYDGVVIKRHVERGEWLSPGSPVATLARYDFVDVVVNLPEWIIGFIGSGREVKVRAGGGEFAGKVSQIIPKGDVSTRTFPVKIRLKNPGHLKEGMEARVRLPAGKGIKTLIVPRDAVITVFGRTVIFAVVDSKARMLPVNVTGYEGTKTGIKGEGLKEGMKVVVKGHERLRDGQPVVIVK